MPPTPLRKPVSKDRFPILFSTLKTQAYHDPTSRGPGSHTIRSIAWNPTGYLIATGSADRTLRIWNPEKPQVKNSTELRGHAGAIERVAWNPTKEAELTSVSADGTCRFWDVRSKACTAVIQLGGEGLTIAWAGDGSVLIVGRKDDTLIPITVQPTPTAGAPIPQHIQTNQLTFSATSPPSHLLATRGDGSISILSYPSLRALHTLHAHTSSCLSLALSPTGRHLAIGGSDALISIYDTWDWVCKRTLSWPVGAVKSVGFTFCGNYVLGGCDEGGSLEVVHVESGESVGKVELIGEEGRAGGLASGTVLDCVYRRGDWGLRIVGAAGGQL